jgi:hypothetical protein
MIQQTTNDTQGLWILNAPKWALLKNSDHFQKEIKNASIIWESCAELEYEKNGDRGACTLGGGLYIWAKHPRCKYPRKTLLISPPNYMGECAKFAGMKEAALWIESAFPSLRGYVTTDYGRLD